jgi:hypothetical protein
VAALPSPALPAALPSPSRPPVLPAPALPAGLTSSTAAGTSLLQRLADDIINGFFRAYERWVETGTAWLLREAWRAMSATTEPVLTGSAFTAEYHVMILIGAGSAVPLVGIAAIGAIARQDPSGLLRTALLRLPMALLLTGVVIELVSLGLTFTDQASLALLDTGGDAVGRLFAHLTVAVGPVAPGLLGFGQLLLVLVVAFVGFMLWIELAVRSAAVAVAALFLPLALAGLIWPATSRWARRLGETLTGLVLMKLVMAAVLALAGGALSADAGGLSSIVEGVALLGLTVFSPFALFRLIPMVEAGAVSHLEGVQPAAAAKNRAWSLASDGMSSLKGALSGSKAQSRGSTGPDSAGLPSAGASFIGGAGGGGGLGGGGAAGGGVGGAGAGGGGGGGGAEGGGGVGGGGGGGGGVAGGGVGGAGGGAPAGPGGSGGRPSSGGSPAGSGGGGSSSAAGGRSSSVPQPRGEAGWAQFMAQRRKDGGRGGS